MHEGSHERQGMALGLAGSWLQQMSNQSGRLLKFEKKACLELLVPFIRGSFTNSRRIVRWRWLNKHQIVVTRSCRSRMAELPSLREEVVDDYARQDRAAQLSHCVSDHG